MKRQHLEGQRSVRSQIYLQMDGFPSIDSGKGVETLNVSSDATSFTATQLRVFG